VIRRSFASLEVPNYRRYFAGQLISVTGNWMQMVAEIWLILTLTGSAFAVGMTTALQFLPILLFGALGGMLADRIPKRSLLIATQSLMALPALVLWGLVVSGAVEPWMVLALVFIRGSVNAVDNPTRQSFVTEMVGSERVVNAVGLNSFLIHSARIFGPAGAGILIAAVGIAPCFLINTLSFAGMIVALRAMEPGELEPAPVVPRERGAVRAALRYVAATPGLAVPLAMMALVGTLGFNFQVILPLLARFEFDAGAGAYSLLAVSMALGAVAGSLATGARNRVSDRLIVAAALAFGLLALAAAAAPTLAAAAILLVPLGGASVLFAAGVNSALQLRAEPSMRGRVMALYSMVFLGTTPIGGPIAGALSGALGPRAALLLTALAALTAATGGYLALSPHRRRGGLFGRWRRWRVPGRGAVATEAGRAHELQGFERGAGLDVEADPVALLDRSDGGLALAPGERDRDRVAGADRRDAGPDPGHAGANEGERADRPKPAEGDPARAIRRQAGRRAGAGEQRGHRFVRPRGAPEEDADEGRERPPPRRDQQGQRVRVAIGGDHGDRAQRGRDPTDEQHGSAQEVAEEHQLARSRRTSA
jgi:MFS family permease